MNVKIRTKGFRFFMPVPISLAGFVLNVLPEQVFAEMQAAVPEPYGGLVTKRNVQGILRECLDIFKENRGLEIVHVEAADGTFVSVVL